tara:strand:- start:264 stop:407 length:144 start_codon:yes stop_codon:yes gene_type:complete
MLSIQNAAMRSATMVSARKGRQVGAWFRVRVGVRVNVRVRVRVRVRV